MTHIYFGSQVVILKGVGWWCVCAGVDVTHQFQKAENRTFGSLYQCALKGSFTIFLFSVRSCILNSNGVWYNWFWPEGPKNAPNSIFGGFKFAPRDLDSQRHMGPRLAAQGTLTRSAGDLDSQRRGPRLAAPVKVPWRCESRSPGDKIKTPKSLVLGIFRLLRAKSPIPHPITIQNMRSDRK